jgi:uncharacterized protein (DUF488 family)
MPGGDIILGDETQEKSVSNELFTIGHSNHPIERLIELLKGENIAIVVDVRSSPYSRYSPQFNKEFLAQALDNTGIEYQYYGEALGGMPKEREFYDSDGHVLYGKIAKSERFEQGIEHLHELIRFTKMSIMCSEENPSECHRRLLITRVMKGQGVAVFHIRGDGTVESETELEEKENQDSDKGQLSMFTEKVEKEWKSTRSVSRKNPQNNFSEY